MGYLYTIGIQGEYHPWLPFILLAIFSEGIVLWLNQWECPLTPLHRKYNDDKGFFGMFLPKAILPYVIPALGLATLIALCLVFIRVAVP